MILDQSALGSCVAICARSPSFRTLSVFCSKSDTPSVIVVPAVAFGVGKGDLAGVAGGRCGGAESADECAGACDSHGAADACVVLNVAAGLKAVVGGCGAEGVSFSAFLLSEKLGALAEGGGLKKLVVEGVKVDGFCAELDGGSRGVTRENRSPPELVGLSFVGLL